MWLVIGWIIGLVGLIVVLAVWIPIILQLFSEIKNTLKNTIFLPQEVKDSIRILKNVKAELMQLYPEMIIYEWNEIERGTIESIMANKQGIIRMNKLKGIPLRLIVLRYILNNVELLSQSRGFPFNLKILEGIYNYVAKSINVINQAKSST